jgi:hypothetical protein
MQTHLPILILSITSLTGLSIVAWAILTGWRDWLAVKRLALQSGREFAEPASPAARIELADLKERIRKLEAIASGVDLLP